MDDRLSLERSNPAAADEYNASKLLKFKVTKTDINIKYHLQRKIKAIRYLLISFETTKLNLLDNDAG